MQLRNRTIRWVALATLITCGAVAVPQPAFAGAAGRHAAGTDHATTKNTTTTKNKSKNKSKDTTKSKDTSKSDQVKDAKPAKDATATAAKAWIGPMTVLATPTGGASVASCAEPFGVTATAAWSDATIEDHDVTTLDVTLTRPDSCGDVTGLGYVITLPAGTYRSYASVVNDCASDPLNGSAGDTTFTVTNATIFDPFTTCTIKLPVSSGTSGEYIADTATFTGTTDVMVSQTPQTLIVTTAPPRIGASFSPSTIDALGTSALTVGLNRTDENAAAVSSGLAYRLDLPPGLLVAAGAPSSDCGGTFTATAGASYATLSGGTLTGAPAQCEATFNVTSSIADEYSLANASVSDTTGVQANLTGNCAESGRAESGCQPTLLVNSGGGLLLAGRPRRRTA